MGLWLQEDIKCVGCGKQPHELEEYRDAALGCGYKAAWEYVVSEEGTYNSGNGHFLCTPCYIKADCPTAPNGWVAP